MNWSRILASIIIVAFGIAAAIGFSVLTDMLPDWMGWPLIILCLLFVVFAVYFSMEEEEEEKDAPKVHGWVAVDKDSVGNRRVTFFPLKPVRDELTDFHYWASRRPFDVLPLSSTAFPDMTWEDEPIEVELIVREIE